MGNVTSLAERIQMNELAGAGYTNQEIAKQLG